VTNECPEGRTTPWSDTARFERPEYGRGLAALVLDMIVNPRRQYLPSGIIVLAIWHPSTDQCLSGAISRI
jgi:hypothetical protein